MPIQTEENGHAEAGKKENNLRVRENVQTVREEKSQVKSQTVREENVQTGREENVQTVREENVQTGRENKTDEHGHGPPQQPVMAIHQTDTQKEESTGQLESSLEATTPANDDNQAEEHQEELAPVINGYREDVLEEAVEEKNEGADTESHAQQEVATVNGEAVNEGETSGQRNRWSFPPMLEDFDLMESEVDPADLEQIFADNRYG